MRSEGALRADYKWQMGNEKWQIKCEMRNAKCEMKMPDTRCQSPEASQGADILPIEQI